MGCTRKKRGFQSELFSCPVRPERAFSTDDHRGDSFHAGEPSKTASLPPGFPGIDPAMGKSLRAIAMPPHACLIVFLCLPVLGGCGSIQKSGWAPFAAMEMRPRTPPQKTRGLKPPAETVVVKTADAHGKKKPVAKPVDPPGERHSWWTRTRQQLAQIAKDVQSDLAFHETEGLDSFGPDAAEQVRLMRADMNGSADLVR